MKTLVETVVLVVLVEMGFGLWLNQVEGGSAFDVGFPPLVTMHFGK